MLNPVRIIVICAVLIFLSSPSSSPLAWVNCPAMDADGYHAASNKSPDLNSDGYVDLPDFVMFADVYPPNPGDYCADYAGDPFITLVDFSVFALHYGHSGGQMGLCD